MPTASAAALGKSSKATKVSKTLKSHPYLVGDHISLVRGWENMQAREQVDQQLQALKVDGLFSLYHLAGKLASYGSDDLTVCKRGEIYEVWAHRDFNVGGLTFAPETSELKDRYWQQSGRAVVCGNGSKLHPEKKSWVLDGRLRGHPSESRPFSLFWLPQRLPAAETKDANLAYGFAEIAIGVEITLPTKRKLSEDMSSSTNILQIPVMYNPKKIKAGTLLTVPEDENLKKALDSERVRGVHRGVEVEGSSIGRCALDQGNLGRGHVLTTAHVNH